MRRSKRASVAGRGQGLRKGQEHGNPRRLFARSTGHVRRRNTKYSQNVWFG